MIAIYLITLEITLYGSAVYLFKKKKELAILYLPVHFFIYTSLLDDAILRNIFWYLMVTSMLAYAVYKCFHHRTMNIFTYLLILLFTYLYIFNSHSIVETRPQYFSIIWLAVAILIIPDLYAKYQKRRIISELNKMCLTLLVLFIMNSIVSTSFGYCPKQMYGAFSGVLYGGLYASQFNVIPVVLFALLVFSINREKSYMNVMIGVISFILLMLSMRRSVIFVAIIGICIVLFYLLYEKNIIKVISFVIMSIAIAFIITFVGIADQFVDRFESRFHSRALVSTDEGRFQDFILIYKDLFVYNRYDKLFGYEFFNAPGNYGLGRMRSRNLHSDIPVILHASGLAGLSLFLLMIISNFRYSWRFCDSDMDKSIFLFCTLTFVVFSFTGRITQTSYAIGVFLLLMLPVSNRDRYEENNSSILR